MSHEAGVSGEGNNETPELGLTAFINSRGSTDSGNSRNPNVQWKPASRTVEETLAQGLSNEDLWLLIRRFNKQIYHVKAIDDTAGRNLDLSRVEDEQFPPEKLRMTIERFYTSVIVGVTEFCRQVTRLRSWREPRRTTVFALAYFLAWHFNILVPTSVGLLMALIMFPPLRPMLFPCSPASTGSKLSDGEVQQTESHDSITGVPEAHKGEAAEQEAKNMIDSVANIAIETAAGKYGQTVAEDAEEVPTSSSLPSVPVEEDGPEGVAEDKTKKPIKMKVARGTDQVMRVISDVTDVYEQFANLMSPTPPFNLVIPRLRLLGILGLVFLAFPFTSSHLIVKSVGFTLGLGFFGDPLFVFGMAFLNKTVPDWKDRMDIQKTLLEGTPTNAQLTLTLLRIGEINSAPLPPPPNSSSDEPEWPIRRKKSSTELLTEGSSALESTESLQTIGLEGSIQSVKPPKKKFFSRLLRFVRRTIATAIKGHIAFDRAMAIAGSAHTKNLLSMLQSKHFSSKPFGPLKFDAKFMKKRGAAVIDSTKEPPLLYFTTYQSAGLDDLRIESRKKGSVLFQIPVTDIRELKKTEGLGWKGKLIVELTAGSKEAADGLVINGKEEGQSFHLTGMRSRNQLFNRLVAMDAQFWESR
ncbi:Uncharacterized protein PECH_007102 [Penicillium ucsense]|uniref:Uncharacterized protein n=1 Tax=Penicillium ucsense TaxID=2839758 RepID=A0A8J8W120_9EURO|nr:Uncharacterized protein PECM_006887 [Penicillium ucsense]KAF7735128.1 Uncharacterized protein PECH_007102 [Penicillium ucsense]